MPSVSGKLDTDIFIRDRLIECCSAERIPFGIRKAIEPCDGLMRHRGIVALGSGEEIALERVRNIVPAR